MDKGVDHTNVVTKVRFIIQYHLGQTVKMTNTFHPLNLSNPVYSEVC